MISIDWLFPPGATRGTTQSALLLGWRSDDNRIEFSGLVTKALASYEQA
jgi:hypothetical protein